MNTENHLSIFHKSLPFEFFWFIFDKASPMRFPASLCDPLKEPNIQYYLQVGQFWASFEILGIQFTPFNAHL